MGFMRKALFIQTAGMSRVVGIRTNSKKDRSAKALEKLVKMEKKRR